MKWFSYTWLLNISFVAGAVIIIVFLYLIITTKKRKYNHKPLNLYEIRDKYLNQISGNTKDVSEPQPQKKKEKKINKSEERCREIFEDYFGVPFKSIRPDWLSNPGTDHKYNLELDGFNPDIKTNIGKGLAFEYDGGQHSKYTPHFHRQGPKEFEYQVKKDMWKDIQCKNRGILLIRIPHYVIYEDLDKYIINKLKLHGL